MSGAARRPRASRRLRTALDRVMIHEIRNIAFRLRLVESNLEAHYGDPDFKRSLQDVIASTVERLDGIVGRYSRDEPALLVKIEVDLNAILRRIGDGATRRGSRLSAQESARLPVLSLSLGAVPAIWGDPYFLTDALTSLLENAIEAADERGKVLIRTYASGTGARRRAVVEIIDNGRGMSPEFVRERLFRPFQTTKPEGVGLGLFTAHEIVRSHRGTIRLRSEGGTGTVVRLSFPGASAS